MGKMNSRWIWGLMLLYSMSCTYYQNNDVFIPPVEEQTKTLEASYVSTPPTSFNDAYWKTADYLAVKTNEISSGQAYNEKGLLNANNMFNGKEDFNGNQESGLRLKAGYDNENLYILATWSDDTYNASWGNWFYNGPNDPRKSQDTIGWTSQKNDDNLILAFENANGSDIWKWSLSTSDPIGYMLDMHVMNNEWVFDAGTPVFERNAVDPDNFRSGPKTEWNGPTQELTRIPGVSGSFAQLDPAYFILNKSTFVGNVANGELLYQSKCANCHGISGKGDGYRTNTGVAINGLGYFTRYTRTGLDQFLANGIAHPGAGYWVNLTTAQKDDVMARLRGMSSVPGVSFQVPSGSSADIRAYSNVLLGRIDETKENPGYKVLIIRKLQTGNADDIQFNLSESLEYEMNVYLTDDDDQNMVGENNRKLTFKK